MPKIKQKTTGNITPISELRHRQRVRQIRNMVLVGIALILLVLYASGAYGRGLAMLGDLVDSALIGIQPGEGYPAKTGIAEVLQVESLAGGFVELGKKDLVVFAANGNQLRDIAHNYSRPAISSGDTRFVLYNRSGYELRVENRTRTLYTHTYEQPLLLASMSENGTLAVITSSARYAAECMVYNTSFESVFDWKLTEKEGTPVRVAFAQDNKRFAVACLKAENGALVSNIYLLDTRKDQITSTIGAVSGQVLQMEWLSTNTLLVIYNGKAVVYNAETGEEKAVYSFGEKVLQSASISGRNVALLFEQGIADAPSELVVLNAKMQESGTASVPSPTKKVVCTRSGVYVLRESSVAAYDLSGEAKWEMQLETPPLAVLDAKKLLVFEGGSAKELKRPTE